MAANPDVARYQDRHGAVIQRRQVMQWLDHGVPQSELVLTPPARFFEIEETDTAERQAALRL